jgi:uncharacterized caspase-like protein
MIAENGDELTRVMARSQELERTLQRYDVDSRAIDGRTATIAARLEDQLGTLDRQIELFGALDRADPDRQGAPAQAVARTGWTSRTLSSMCTSRAHRYAGTLGHGAQDKGKWT